MVNNVSNSQKQKVLQQLCGKEYNKIFAVTIFLDNTVMLLQICCCRKYHQHPNEIVTNNSRVKSMASGSWK